MIQSDYQICSQGEQLYKQPLTIHRESAHTSSAIPDASVLKGNV